jgi:hypothetical protein
MDKKEYKLKIIDRKIVELWKEYIERKNLVMRTTDYSKIEIRPYQFHCYDYRKEIDNKLWASVNSDKLLRELNRDIESLKEYKKYFQKNCNEYNHRCFVVPILKEKVVEDLLEFE